METRKKSMHAKDISEGYLSNEYGNAGVVFTTEELAKKRLNTLGYKKKSNYWQDKAGKIAILTRLKNETILTNDSHKINQDSWLITWNVEAY